MKNTRHLGPGSSAVTTATARYAVAASDPLKRPRMARIKAVFFFSFPPHVCPAVRLCFF